MLSRNNFKERLRKQEPKKQRFAIRKLTVGVASVLVGFTLMGMSASADTTANTDNTADKSNDQTANVESNVPSATKQVTLQSSSDQEQQNVQSTTKNQDQPVKTTEESNTSAINGTKQSDNAVSTDKSNTQKLVINGNTLSTMTPEALATSLATDYGGKMYNFDASTGVVEIDGFYGLSRAIVDRNVKTIRFTTDIDITNMSHSQGDAANKGGTHGLWNANGSGNIGSAYGTGANTGSHSYFKNIARNLTIDGNGHSLIMGDKYIQFWDENYEGTTNGWQLVIKNFSNLSQTGAANAPFYFNTNSTNTAKSSVTYENDTINLNNSYLFNNSSAAITVKDSTINAQKANVINAAGTVTIDGIKTGSTVTGGDFISGVSGDVTINDTNMTVTNGSFIDSDNSRATFTGTNVIDSPNDTLNYDMVKAKHIIFDSGNITLSMSTKDSGVNAHNPKGIIVHAMDGDSNGESAVTIKQGATVNINGQSTDVRGIILQYDGTGSAPRNGSVQIDGNYNANMSDGHSIAISTGDLTIGITGKVVIYTKQDNHGAKTWTNPTSTFNGWHWAPISMGVGANSTNISIQAPHSNLIDNGSLTIIRTNEGQMMTGLITYGTQTAGSSRNPSFLLQVGQGAILNLQDASARVEGDGMTTGNRGAYTNTPKVGMITMAGTSSKDRLVFDNPGYVNLQRTKSLVGSFIRLEGTDNETTITGPENGLPLSQWDEANFSNTPSFTWYVKNERNINNWGDNAVSGFGNSGNGTPVNAKGSTFINAGDQNASVTLAGNSDNPNSLNSFQNQFNWWTPQRISFGSSKQPDIHIKDSDQYDPNVQTITTTVGNHLQKNTNGVPDSTDTDGISVQKGIAGLTGPDGEPITDPTAVAKIIDWSKTHWYNADTDSTEYNNQFKVIDKNGNESVTNKPKTADLSKVGNTSNTATIVYQDGTIDFVDVPIQVNSIADQAVEVGLATSTWDGYREIQIVRDSSGKIAYYKLNYDATKKVPLSHNYKASDFVKAHDSSDTLYEGVTYSFDAATQKLLDNNDDHTILAANNGSHYVKLGIIATYKDGSTKNLSGRLTILEFPVFKPIYTKFGQLPTPDISWVQNAGDKDTPWLVQSVDKNYAITPTVNDADLGYSQYSVQVYYGATNGELDENGNLINATSHNTPVWDFLDGMYIINPQTESHYRFEDQVDNFKTLTSGTINQGEGSATLNFDINGKSETIKVNTGEVSFGDYLKQLKNNGLFNSMPNNTTITGKWDQSDRSKAGIYHLTYHFNYGKQGNTQQVQQNGNVFDDAGNTSYGLVDGIFNGFTEDSNGNYTQDVVADLYVLKEPVGGTLKINRGDSTAFADLDKRFGDDQIVTNLDSDNSLNPRSIDKTKGWLKGAPSNTKSSDNQVETTYVIPINGGTTITRAANVHIIVLTDADQYDLRGGSMFMWNDNTALAKALSNGVELSRLKTARNLMNGFLRPTTTNGQKNFSSIYDVIRGTRKADKATLIRWNLNDVSQSGLKLANVTITYPDGSTDVVKMNVYVLEEPHFVRYNQTRPQSGSITINANAVVGNTIDGKDGHPKSVKWVVAPEINSKTPLGIYPESKANIYVQYALPTDTNGQDLQLVGWPKNGFEFSVPTIFITHDIWTTILKGKTNVTAIDSNINTNQLLSLKTIANDGTTQTFSPQSDGTMVSANGQVWGAKLMSSKLAISDAHNLANLVDLGGLSANDYALSWEKTPTVQNQKLTGMIRAQLGNNMFISIPVDCELVADSAVAEPTHSDSTTTKPTDAKPSKEMPTDTQPMQNDSTVAQPTKSNPTHADSTFTKSTETKPLTHDDLTVTEPVSDDGEVSDLAVDHDSSVQQSTPVTLVNHETVAATKQQDSKDDQKSAADHHALPQTGNHASAIAGLGLAGVMTMFGLLGKRHRQD